MAFNNVHLSCFNSLKCLFNSFCKISHIHAVLLTSLNTATIIPIPISLSQSDIPQQTMVQLILLCILVRTRIIREFSLTPLPSNFSLTHPFLPSFGFVAKSFLSKQLNCKARKILDLGPFNAYFLDIYEVLPKDVCFNLPSYPCRLWCRPVFRIIEILTWTSSAFEYFSP